MVSSCSAYGCTNRSSFPRKIQFHRFPFRDPKLLMRWVIAVRRQNWWPTQCSCICSDHFTDDDYRTKQKFLLKNEAVPSIFNFSPPKQKEKKYKRSLKQSSGKYKRKKFKPDDDKPINDAATADANSNSVSNEPVVIFLSDVHSDSVKNVALDKKNSATKNLILNENDMVDFILNATSDVSIPDASNFSVERISVNQQIERTASTNNMTDSELNYVEHASTPTACNDSVKDVKCDDVSDCNSSDTTDKVPLVVNISGICSVPKCDISVSVKQLTGKIVTTGNNVPDLDMNSTDSKSVNGLHNGSLKDMVKPQALSVERGLRLNSVSDASLPGSCNDPPSVIPLVISISGICVHDLNAMSDVSVSVKQLTERNDSEENKKSTFKLKSVRDRIISDTGSDSMTDDSR